MERKLGKYGQLFLKLYSIVRIKMLMKRHEYEKSLPFGRKINVEKMKKEV